MRTAATVIGSLVLVAAVGCGDEGTLTGGDPATEFEQDCRVSFGVSSGAYLATLEVWIDYAAAEGHFAGGGENVECERLDDRWAVWSVNQCRGADGACDEGDSYSHQLTFIGRATHDISTPAGLATCRFVGKRIPKADELRVRLEGATDEYLREVSPPPTVEVTAIECRSTSSTTSTTVEPFDPCEDVACSDRQVCVDGECQPTDRYAVDVSLDGDHRLGALQLELHYDCHDGEFEGERDQVRCVGNSALNASILFNDYGCSSDLGSPRVMMSFLSLHGFTGPVRLATCEYTSADESVPTSATFSTAVIDSTDPELAPVSGVTASVAVRPVAP
jgi:hypothetical protein